MARFDLFAAPGRHPDIPFVALPWAADRAPEDHPLTPRLTVLGERVFADPLNIATIPARRLGDPVTTLDEASADAIVRAIDEMISRA